ncbi:hypothetical protein [Chitinophaga barathri]|uniref:Uncharacterized protein n=1 Tax=Chitinophaga barathri TaxID=1647451 RepID=A0A3N4N674_9BACT|nr:hypothetical protein [Chitinophaga barathri]RPD43143.1 hypothetical protein EG028_02275 [Chitinophaga barathri]
MIRSVTLLCLTLMLVYTGCARKDSITPDSERQKILNYLHAQAQKYPQLQRDLPQLDLKHYSRVKSENVEILAISLPKKADGLSERIILELENGIIKNGFKLSYRGKLSEIEANEQILNFYRKDFNHVSGQLDGRQFSENPLFSVKFNEGKLSTFSIATAKPRRATEMARDIQHPRICTHWYWVTYNSTTGEIYSTDYMYTSCEGEAGGAVADVDAVGGSSEVTTNPCDRAGQFAGNNYYMDRLEALLSPTYMNINYEVLSISSRNYTGGPEYSNFFQGSPNQHSVSTNWSAYGQRSITTMVHTHVQGGSSFYSVSDLHVMYSVVKNGQVYDVEAFNMMLATYNGTVYNCQVDNLNAFIAFGDTWLNSENARTLLELRWSEIYNIKGNNSPAQNQAGMESWMNAMNTGLVFYQGNTSNLSSWTPIFKNSNGQLIKVPCQ